MAQIAAEELGLPLEHVTVVARRLGARAVRDDLGRLVDDAVDGARRCARPPPTRSGRSSSSRRSATTRSSACSTLRGGHVVAADGGAGRSTRSSACSSDGQILGKGARGPNPTGMQVLTFGVQVAEVAVDVETGEVARRADRGDPRRRPRDQPARRVEPGRGRDHPGRSATRSPRSGCVDPATGTILTRTLDAYRMPTIADVPEIVCEFVDVPDAHLTNLGSKGLGEPPIIPVAAAIANAIRDATGRRRPLAADHARGDAAGAARGAGARREERAWSSCGRLASTTLDAAPATVCCSRAGRRSCRCSATGLSQADDARRRARGARCRAGIDGTTRIGAGTTLAELEADPQIPDALREACRLAASPQLREHGHDRRQPAAGDALLVLAAQVPVPPARRRPLPRARGRAPRARDLRQRLLRVGSPVRRRRGAARARRDAADEPARAAGRRAVPRCPTEDDRAHDDARAGRADPRARRARARGVAST